MPLNPIDIASTGPALADSSAYSGAASAESTGTPSGFGQLMSRAFEQIGLPGRLAPGGDPTLAMAGLAGQDPGSNGSEASSLDNVLATPAGLDPALMPGWMNGWPQPVLVQQLSVGPTLQVITPSTPAPDDSSLAAFAQAQGLDAQAIAWLLGGKEANATGAAADPLLTVQPEAAAAALLVATAPGQPGAPATTAPPLAFPLPAAPTSPPGQTLPGLINPQATGPSVGPSAGPALATAAWITGISVWQDGATRPVSKDPQPGSGEPADADAALNALRWAGTAAGAGAATLAAATLATRQTGNWTFAAAPPTPWVESELDLGELASGPSALDLEMPPGALEAEALPMNREPSAQGASPSANASAQPAAARAEASARGGQPARVASDQMQQLSEQMADAVGERLVREIERGHWNVRLMLKPAHLGHIEVEMRMRAGELDASFVVPQGATRDLLQDGLSRLKETLNQMGMDVANLDVKTGQNRQNGGDPTPGRARETAKTSGQKDSEAPAQVSGSTPRPRSADGWDVMV